MPLYEHVFIARQDISSAQVDSLTSTFSALVKEHGGKVEKAEYWGLRTLAYRIKKNRKGHYVLFNLDAPPAALQELERNERLNEDILRYLTIRVEELEEGPSVLMRNRAVRDEHPKERGSYDRDVKPKIAPANQAPEESKAAPATPELKEEPKIAPANQAPEESKAAPATPELKEEPKIAPANQAPEESKAAPDTPELKEEKPGEKKEKEV